MFLTPSPLPLPPTLPHPQLPSTHPVTGCMARPPPPHTLPSFLPLVSAKVSIPNRFADHLHEFHENDNGAAAGDLWQ